MFVRFILEIHSLLENTLVDKTLKNALIELVHNVSFQLLNTIISEYSTAPRLIVWKHA